MFFKITNLANDYQETIYLNIVFPIPVNLHASVKLNGARMSWYKLIIGECCETQILWFRTLL